MWSRRDLLGTLAATSAAALLPRAGRADDPPLVVIFSSDATPRTQALLRAFKGAMGEALMMSCDLSGEGDAGAFIADNLRDVAVSAVFAAGDVALRVALREFTLTPVIWADTLDHAAAELHPRARGVSPLLDPAAVLSRLRTLKPDLRTLGVLRSAGSADPYWDTLAKACQDAGLGLACPPVGGSAEVDNAFKGLISGADLTWIQPDPTLWTGAVLASLFHEAALAHYPILGFQRDQLKGAQHPPMVAESDPAAMGRDAAALAWSLLKGDPPAERTRYASPTFVADLLSLRQSGLLVNKKTGAAIDVWSE